MFDNEIIAPEEDFGEDWEAAPDAEEPDWEIDAPDSAEAAPEVAPDEGDASPEVAPAASDGKTAPAADDGKIAARQANIRAFLAAYPGVRAEEVPIEVLREGIESGDLAAAYARHENKRLREELETLRQSLKNKERSTGSRSAAGEATPKDAFDEVWEN